MPVFDGTAGDDTLPGSDSDDLLRGLEGNDHLGGGFGNDTLDGGAGHDWLRDVDGGGQMLGGDGNDLIDCRTSYAPDQRPSALLVDGGADDDIIGVLSRSVAVSVTVNGGDGADRITLIGDVAGVIDAGSGDDMVTLGGASMLTGFARTESYVTLGAGSDRVRVDIALPLNITDFQTGVAGDRLELDLSYQIDHWDGSTNPFQTGHFRLVQRGPDTVLQRDSDGPGASGAFTDMVRFLNTSASSFTDVNLFGFAPGGTQPAVRTLTGTEGPDDLIGGVGPETIFGLGGSDILLGREGPDTLDGGHGDDDVSGQLGDDSLSGGAGNDQLYGDDDGSGADTLSGGDGRDWLSGGNGADSLAGDADTDSLMGGGGDDQIDGGAGNDRIQGDPGADTMNGGEGDDWLVGGSGSDRLTGGAGADTYELPLMNTGITLAETDVVTDWSSDDRILLGVRVASAAGAYRETTAADFTTAAADAARLISQGAADFVAVQVASDVFVFSGDGAIRLAGRSLADVSEASVVGARAVEGPATGTAASDNLVLSDSAEIFDAGDGDDTVLAAGGADSVRGGAGDDRVFAGTGDDTIVDAAGANYLRGDEGNDHITGGADFDDINGNMGNDFAFGAAGDDWVVGGRDQDHLYGDAGADIVYGNLGEDTCSGGDGADTVRGGQGNDIVWGDDGDDWLSGDRGDDTITGGTGADIFHGSQDAGIDRVTDFDVGSDRVQLDPGTTYTLRQAGADTVIDMGGGHQMVLVNVQLASLPAGWIFAP